MSNAFHLFGILFTQIQLRAHFMLRISLLLTSLLLPVMTGFVLVEREMIESLSRFLRIGNTQARNLRDLSKPQTEIRRVIIEKE